MKSNTEIKEIAQFEIDYMIKFDDRERDGNIFELKINKEIELDCGRFLLLEGKATQEIKHENSRTYDYEGDIELHEAEYDVDCEVFDESGTIFEFNLRN